MKIRTPMCLLNKHLTSQPSGKDTSQLLHLWNLVEDDIIIGNIILCQSYICCSNCRFCWKKEIHITFIILMKTQSTELGSLLIFITWTDDRNPNKAIDFHLGHDLLPNTYSSSFLCFPSLFIGFYISFTNTHFLFSLSLSLCSLASHGGFCGIPVVESSFALYHP